MQLYRKQTGCVNEEQDITHQLHRNDYNTLHTSLPKSPLGKLFPRVLISFSVTDNCHFSNWGNQTNPKSPVSPQSIILTPYNLKLLLKYYCLTCSSFLCLVEAGVFAAALMTPGLRRWDWEGGGPIARAPERVG